jgi:uncharacterized protein (TIGR03083 family)
MNDRKEGAMGTISKPVDTMSYEGKPLILDVVRTERQAFYDLIDDPANWEVQTRCSEWQVRDVVGHMIDVTEGYLSRWDMALNSETPPDPLGLPAMAELLNEHAQAFRGQPRDEVIARLKSGSDRLMSIFEELSQDEWTNFLVPHPYMGPLPTFFYPAFQVIDYGVHTWDIRYGLGEKLRKLDERTAGVLIPYMFVLFQYTVDAASAQGVECTYGLEVSSEWGGRWRVSVKDGQWSAQPETGGFEGCDAVFSFDPSDFVLSAYQRFPGGSARGDEQVISQVRGLFFAI